MNEVDAGLYDERMRYVLEHLHQREMLITQLEQDRADLITFCKGLQLACDHWRKNHEEMKHRNAVLRERPDLPADRLPAIARYEEKLRRVQELHTALMRSADARYDELHHSSTLREAILASLLSQALEMDTWHPNKVAAFKIAAEEALKP